MPRQSRADYMSAQRLLDALATLASGENPDATAFTLPVSDMAVSNAADDSVAAYIRRQASNASVVPEYSADVFKIHAEAAGTGDITLWTPAAGKKVRLLGFYLTFGAAAAFTFKDGAAGAALWYVQALGAGAINMSLPGAGRVSAAADTALLLSRSASTAVHGVVWGVEE